MKKKKKLFSYCLIVSFLLVSSTACKHNTKTVLNMNITPALLTTSPLSPAITKVLTATPTPEPTPIPMHTIYSFDAEDKKQILVFTSRGEGTINTASTGYNSEHSFLIHNRSDSWHGVSLTINDYNVIGKSIHISFYAMHTEKDPITISCSLQVITPDGSQDWPEHVSQENVAPNNWVFIEGDIPIYSDITDPLIYFDASETFDFYIDNIEITVYDDSVIPNGYETYDS